MKLRLTGVNAPENGECHHEESHDYLRDAVGGRKIVYEVLSTDQFGRLLAHVWVDGRHVNLELVARGHAIATTPPDNDPHGVALLDAESAAEGADLGVWADDACGSAGPLPRIEISEIRVDPPGRDEDDLDGERVTLTNRDDYDVDLDGWTLRDESSRHRFEFPAGSVLKAGETITVESADRRWRPGRTPVWNNSGDLVLLLDPSGRIVDHLRY